MRPPVSFSALRSSVAGPGSRWWRGTSSALTPHDDSVTRINPALAIALGVLLVAIAFVVPGSTRDLILRIAGGAFIVAGAVVWVVARRRS